MTSVKELLLIFSLLATAFIVGALTSTLGWSLLIATYIWLTVQWRQFRKIKKWSTNPWRKPRNGFDGWFNIAYQPYRTLMRERTRTRQATQRLRQILNLTELIPDAVIVLGPNSIIDGMNKAATQLIQISENDIGLGLSTIVRNPDFVEFIRTTTLDSDFAFMEFVSPLDPDSTLEARRLDIEDGGMILLIRDITTLNRLLTVRQNFVANVSHELRTPLAVLKGYLETVNDPTEEPDVRLGLAKRLSPPLQRMQTLVDDLTLLTQLEATDVETEHPVVNLRAVLENTLDELGGLIVEGRINLTLSGQTQIEGVEPELHSVCTNLINNALKYSPENAAIDVSCIELNDCIRLSVKDYGAGIAPEHLDRLTERFYRVDMADARTRGGTGLGLAIVKHVLRRHNTTLNIESELGNGSQFSCDFRKPNKDTH